MLWILWMGCEATPNSDLEDTCTDGDGDGAVVCEDGGDLDGLEPDCNDSDPTIGASWDGRYEGDWSLDSEDEMAAFCRCYTEISGELSVLYTDVESLTELSCLVSAGGLTIRECHELTSLSGLESLEHVEGYLDVGNNDRLETARFPSLSTLGSIYVRHNLVLTEVSGLSVTDFFLLDVSYNPELPSLSGFQTARTVERLHVKYSTFSDLSGLDALEDVGDLTIGYNDMLTSLDGLDALREVSDEIDIRENPLLTDLTALSGTWGCGGEFLLYANDTLVSLSGLDCVGDLGGTVDLQDNPSLTDVSALSGITGISGDLILDSNAVLADLEGAFTAVEQITGDVIITDNAALTGLSMPVLNEIGGDLYLYYNAELADLSELTSLSDIGGSMTLHWAGEVSDLDGFSGVRTIGGSLFLWGNAKLDSVLGLHDVESIGDGFTIHNHPILTDEEAETLSEAVGEDNIGGTISISGNATP